MNLFAGLATQYEERAVAYDADGLEVPARIYRRVAADIRHAIEAADHEVLTLAQAAEVVGCSRDTVRRAVADGRIPNAGRKYAPRVHRGELGIIGKRPTRPKPGALDIEDDARRLAVRMFSSQRKAG